VPRASTQKIRHRVSSHLIVDAKTSERLSRVRQHGTTAELLVRQALHDLGHGYRVRNQDLPGSPDIANRKRKWAVFVHGCFWHRHAGCRRTTTPSRNREFWLDKFDANVRRDEKVQRQLKDSGWSVVVIWECEVLARPSLVLRKLKRLSLPRP